MIWFVVGGLLSCQIEDQELVAIAESAQTQPIQEVEKGYLRALQKNGPSIELYHALELVLRVQGKTEEAHVASKRQEVLASWRPMWGWLGGLLAFCGLCFLSRNRWYALVIPIGMGISSLAFFEDLRYKGTVLFASVGVHSMPSSRSTALFSLSKGIDVRIIEQHMGFLLIEWNAKQGWVEENQILSWDPVQSFVLIEE